MTDTKRPRRWDTGTVRPYRPAPVDFRERYLEMGWDGIEDHYRTNYRCIARWIEECGGDELRQARAAITGGKLSPTRRSHNARRYVLGQRVKKMDRPTFFDAELMEDGK